MTSNYEIFFLSVISDYVKNLNFLHFPTKNCRLCETVSDWLKTNPSPEPWQALWPRRLPLPRPGLMFVASASCSRRLRCCRNSGSSLRFILSSDPSIHSARRSENKETKKKKVLKNGSISLRLSIHHRFRSDPRCFHRHVVEDGKVGHPAPRRYSRLYMNSYARS